LGYPQNGETVESYPDLKNNRKADLQTVSEARQVIEKKEENAVVHRN